MDKKILFARVLIAGVIIVGLAGGYFAREYIIKLKVDEASSGEASRPESSEKINSLPVGSQERNEEVKRVTGLDTAPSGSPCEGSYQTTLPDGTIICSHGPD